MILLTIYIVRLTRVVVVVSGFRRECFLPNSFSSFCEKPKEVENEEKTIDGLQKSLSEGKHGLFLINKRSLKTV